MFQSAFSREKNEENSDTDMYMPPLVHVRTLFFLFLLRLVSSLSSFVIFPLSFSVCLPCDVALVLCWCVCVCLCVLGEGEPVCTFKMPSVSRFQTSPCMPTTCARIAGTHGNTTHATTTNTHTTTHNTDHTRHATQKQREKKKKSEAERR